MPLQVRKLQGGPGPQEREARTERVVDAAVAAGVEGAAPMLASARAATEGEPASAPAAAAGAGLTMPSASWPAGPHLAEEGGRAVEEAEAVGEQVHTEEAEVAASPSPVPAFVIAEVVTAAARQGTGEPSARDSAERGGRSASQSRQEIDATARGEDDLVGNDVVPPAAIPAPAAMAPVEAPLTADSVARNTRYATRRAAIT
ncbi:unnamed protein product [Closterium sp. NIES-65]|nr:unnamed protein product [Closterium sp. NIES-65]